MSGGAADDLGPESGMTPDLDASTVIAGRARDLGGFSVRRLLPAVVRRMIGPFAFFDHMGPAQFAAGQGMDVRPHPHIGLATVTYLFDGEIMHRDSLGSAQPIRPGDVNWMVAGSGIVHSERTPAEARAGQSRAHGLQCWVALPTRDEEIAPRFEHHDASALPVIKLPGVHLTVIAGDAYGEVAPTGVLSPTLYVHAHLDADASLPLDREHEERALYVVDGDVELGARTVESGTMIVLRRGDDVLKAKSAASVMLLGGAPVDGQRHVWWNFVSSSRERIEQAKSDWREGRFGTIPGDDQEFIPLPD